MLNTAIRWVEAGAAIMDASLLCAYVISLYWLECLLKSTLYNSEAFIKEIILLVLII